ncbi:MAG: hypothetical protein KF745_04635 [Phycisphaeraceae bacterium]|nr:hypothetical protein [Phycisphaeraceae bacterium]
MQDALRGPHVPDDMTHTLVRRDARGRLVRIEGRPESAALVQMSIDPDRREKAREVIADRTATLRTRLIESVTASEETIETLILGDRAAIQKVSTEIIERIDPDAVRDPLLEPLSAVLSPDETAELKTLTDDYWTAWIDSEKRANQTPAQVEQRLIRSLLLDELRAAYDSSLRPYRDRLDRVNQAVDPTPEQRAALFKIVVRFIATSRLQPTEEQRAALAREIYGALEEPQRIKIFELALSRF